MNARSRSTAILLGCAVAVLLLSSGIGVAGDFPALVFPEEETYAVTQGETVDIEILVTSDGATSHDAVAGIEVVALFDPEHVSAVDVEVDDWLVGGEETNVSESVAIDGDAGIVRIEQWRDPPRNGTTGHADAFATVTFRVEADAPETNVTVEFADTTVNATSEYPAPISATPATIVISEPEGPWYGLRAAGITSAVALVLASVIGLAWWRRRNRP